jgi:predicted transposase YbfD/YdcC
MVVPAVVVSPIVAVLEQADLPALDPGDRAGTAGVAVSLVEAFERVPDPRQARGIRHGLVPLLVLAACAVMTGARSFAAIGEYARDKGRLVLDTLGADGAVAHSATIRRVLVDVDPAGLQEAITAWSLAQLAAQDGSTSDMPTRERRSVIAVDGKTVRGARTRTGDDDGRQPHLVAALDQHTGAVLAQTAVGEKASEIAALPVVLDGLDITDAVITADALHVQRSHADYLHARGAHYLLPVKANQPTLLRRLRALPWTAIGVDARERCRGHGRVETRSIAVVSLDPLPDFGAGEFFPHAAQAVRIVRRRRSLHGRWKTTTTYMITSLSPFQAGPALLARWARRHWRIEALHWIRDNAFDEDRSQVRTGNAPQVMAALRNLAITALRLAGISAITAAMRDHARNPSKPLATYKII